MDTVALLLLERLRQRLAVDGLAVDRIELRVLITQFGSDRRCIRRDAL